MPSIPQGKVSLTEESDPFINDWLKIVGAKRSKVREQEQEECQQSIKVGIVFVIIILSLQQ